MRFKKFSLGFALLGLGVAIPSVLALTVSDWPTTTSGERISASLESVFPAIEPSGLAWHAGLSQLFVVGDEGELASINVADGSFVNGWRVGGDLEDIAFTDSNTSFAYLADEDGKIVKFDLSAGTTVQSWDVTPWMPELRCGDSTCGMEALTYANGYFYAGYQYNGKIYILDLSGSSAIKVGEWSGLSTDGYTGISGLHYRDGYFYALYRNTMAVLGPDGTVLAAYSVPGFAQEGLALGNDSNGDGDANMFIAQDLGGIYSYDNFPLYGFSAPVPVPEPTPEPAPVDPDVDGDGVVASLDCNDADPFVSQTLPYYVDADLDGLGSDTLVSLCSASAPSGYSTNSNDTNDSIPNAGIEISNDLVDNDGDGAIDEFNTVSSNGYHPYYSIQDPSLSSSGKITGYWGRRDGFVDVRYGDGSIYRYAVFTGRSKTSRVSLVSGTAYLSVTLNRTTVVINGYTGLPR